MAYTKETSYGMGAMINFGPSSPTGRQFIVGAATLDNLRIAQEIFKHDVDGILRIYTTLTTALAGSNQDFVFSTTAATSGNTFTNGTGFSKVSTGDKVLLSGTTAPTNFTLGLTYYAINAGASTFQLSLQRGGTAITVGSTGTAVKAVSLNVCLDTIYVLPGHNENVSSATALNFNVAGTKIIGLGIDETRPTLYLDTATTTTITISAPGMSINNIIFDGTGFAAIASMFTITAAATDIEFYGCKFIHANSTNQAGLVITATNAHRLKINGCKFVGDTAGTTNALQLIGGNDIEIIGNYFYAPYTVSIGPVNNITTACLRIKIQNNIMVNTTTSATKVVVMVSTSTGMITGNSVGIGSGTAPFTFAAGWWNNNYSSAAVATNGTLV